MSMIICRFLLFFSLVILLGQSASHKMHLQDYLKSKYLGKVMSFKDDRYQNKVFSGKVINVVRDDMSYFLKLKNGIFLKFQFVAYGASREPTPYQTQKDFMVQAQALQAQDYINSSISSVGSDSDSSISKSSMMTNFNANINEYSKKNVFTTVNKIIYTDLKVDDVLEDLFVVQLDGLYLLDGTRINTFYERWDFEKKD